MDQKSVGEQLHEKLFYEPKNGLLRDESAQAAAQEYCVEYMNFLDAGKTERECMIYAKSVLDAAGFKPFVYGDTYKAGDKVYFINRAKSIVFAIIGKTPMSQGVNIAAAHVDSPRLDLKPVPVYEDSELCLFKTHYYGGIKKYQWTAIPLALHGVIAKKDGTSITVCVGEDEADPVFCVTDLLPHLAQDQMKRTLAQGIKGEELNLLIGSRPFKSDDASEAVKLNILKLLNEKYGIVEDDFISAELEAVPAFKARDIGFDRSMIGAYGHDDRVCAYTALKAILECENPQKTACVVLADKEETGSDGNTGLQSSYLEFFMEDIAESLNSTKRAVLSATKCLSADVNAAFDPTFPEVNERRNAAFINKGVVITKFTGARGKSGTSDASAEYAGEIRRLLDNAGIIWQTGELGKVDMGGGGTVAAYLANLNIEVIDAGVPVLSMHAPYEIVSKLDVYMAYRSFSEFMTNCD